TATAGELHDRGLLEASDVVVSYLLRFDDNTTLPPAERRAALDGWQTSVFAEPSGCVLRLSHAGLLSLERLRSDSGYLRGFTLVHQGRLVAFAAEALDHPSFWVETARPVTAAA